jgi:phosphoadenosine phosphosulfate reductase
VALIDSPRLTDADRAVWERLEHYDDALSRDPALNRKAAKARAVIEQFAAGGGCYAGFSGGKDSVVVWDLLATSAVAERVPVVYVRIAGWANPDVDAVRDAMLARYPDTRYEEITAEPTPGTRDAEGDVSSGARTLSGGFAEAARRFGDRHISGVRAEESGTRRVTMGRNGLASAGSCRPIGWWSMVEVFAWLHRRDLPVHPAYAMSMGGALDRRRLRVASLGGDRGTGFGRREWEQRYYPDVLAAARVVRAGGSGH